MDSKTYLDYSLTLGPGTYFKCRKDGKGRTEKESATLKENKPTPK